jgi:hypothetical protein
MSRTRIIVEYIIDNEDWSEQEFEDNQDTERTLEITEDMLEDLILQNSNLQPGEFIDSIIRITKT